MRILLFHDWRKPQGGACHFYYQQAKLLRENGHQVLLFVLDKNNVSESAGKIPQKVYFEPKFPILHYLQKYFSLRLFLSLRKAIQEFKPDIIHLHQNLKSTASILLAAKSLRVPIIQTIHDFQPACISSWGVVKTTGEPCLGGSAITCFANKCLSYKEFFIYVIPWKIRQCFTKRLVNVIISPSQTLGKTLKKLGYKNVVILHNFTYPIKKPSSFNNKSPTILCIAGLTKRKGIHYLLQAFKKVLAKNPKTKLLIAGEGIEKQFFLNLGKRLGISRKVTFIGTIAHDKLEKFYQKASILVLPSIWMENCPLVVLEAMSCGLPVVGSNIGGIPELVQEGKTGMLFKPRDRTDLADKIIYLLGHPEITKTMGEKAIEAYQENYTPEIYYEKLIRIYKKVVDGKYEDKIFY